MNNRFSVLNKRMRTANLDALLVTDKINRRYLCGFTGSNGLLMVMPNKNILLIDGRYTEQALHQVKDVHVYTLQSNEALWPKAVEFLSGLTRIGFEKDALSFGSYLALQNSFPLNNVLVPTTNLVEELRMIKAKDELVKLQQAAELADLTFAYILETIRPGMTEAALANEIDYYSRKLGSEGPAFETIVASGVRTALPHGHASKKLIEKNELVMLDFGCVVDGYYSDMTRTFALGKVSKTIKERYQLLLEAQKVSLAGIQVGKKLFEIDAAARNYLDKVGAAAYFTHGIGHGIGLSCHEYPYLNQASQEVLQPKMTFTVEPGIYYKGSYGIRIEDDVFINEQGNPVLLTKAEKEWMSIPWN